MKRLHVIEKINHIDFDDRVGIYEELEPEGHDLNWPNGEVQPINLKTERYPIIKIEDNYFVCKDQHYLIYL